MGVPMKSQQPLGLLKESKNTKTPPATLAFVNQKLTINC